MKNKHEKISMVLSLLCFSGQVFAESYQVNDLGTLRSDNSGTSWTTALSADGSTVAGNAVNDAGDYRAVLWKISKPYLKQSVKIVDVDNSRQAMLNTASKAQRMLLSPL